MTTTDYHAEVANWPDKSGQIENIRRQVFIEEQNVPAELEWDGLDEKCTHFIVRHGSQAIATARLKPDGQIGRMAVLKDHRSRGVGSMLLSAVLTHAREMKFNSVYLHAQVQVIDFYTRHGFTVVGDEFLDAGIPHRAMSRKYAK